MAVRELCSPVGEAVLLDPASLERRGTKLPTRPHVRRFRNVRSRLGFKRRGQRHAVLLGEADSSAAGLFQRRSASSNRTGLQQTT